MDDIALNYYGHAFDLSGYGQAARAYVHALHTAGVRVAVIDLSSGPRQLEDPLVSSLVGHRLGQPDFHLFHGIPPVWAPRAAHLPNVIAMTVWETDRMPSDWRSILSRAIDVWLPCSFNVNTFRTALPTSIFRLPHPVVPRMHNGHRVEPDVLFHAAPTDFVFYSIFEWQERKGPCEILQAYFRAFPNDGEQLLVLKTNPAAAPVATAAIDRLRRHAGSTARVALIAQRWSDAQIDALHGRGNCYVSLHRGEGWGYPLFEAATRGKSVIATAYSGPMDYLVPDAARLVPFTLAPVRQPYVYYESRMQWAEPDVDRAAQLMRDAHDRRDEDEANLATAAGLRDCYSLSRVGEMAKQRLVELRRDNDPRRWGRMTVDTSSPPPLPGDWYDEDYFEHGLKSNWSAGYSWRLFENLFRETASYLIDMFPHAVSYLDAGCAKGFLVRALREAGRECWGFDHSPWAISHVEAAAMPFVERAGVDDVRLERHVDVLVALDLLSQLTEEQARSFLRRARARTRMAIVAVITSIDHENEPPLRHPQPADRDRSHVTRRSRDWWHALFEETGWKLDALHRLGAEHCQQHALPRRMGWKTYVYAP
jgi:glycosyltransferase involved in cell wall biosynthesis/2-polyprenyl-3-methyl-5-hydroxy-6-metoxy-1,4-benzoquinol methylase